jgi:serine/threonine protein kinase
MEMVYKIFKHELEVFRALKILNPATPVGNPDEWDLFCRRFLREAKLLANLHHTHIAQIHSFGEWQQYP